MSDNMDEPPPSDDETARPFGVILDEHVRSIGLVRQPGESDAALGYRFNAAVRALQVGLSDDELDPEPWPASGEALDKLARTVGVVRMGPTSEFRAEPDEYLRERVARAMAARGAEGNWARARGRDQTVVTGMNANAAELSAYATTMETKFSSLLTAKGSDPRWKAMGAALEVAGVGPTWVPKAPFTLAELLESDGKGSGTSPIIQRPQGYAAPDPDLERYPVTDVVTTERVMEASRALVARAAPRFDPDRYMAMVSPGVAERIAVGMGRPAPTEEELRRVREAFEAFQAVTQKLYQWATVRAEGPAFDSMLRMVRDQVDRARAEYIAADEALGGTAGPDDHRALPPVYPRVAVLGRVWGVTPRIVVAVDTGEEVWAGTVDRPDTSTAPGSAYEPGPVEVDNLVAFAEDGEWAYGSDLRPSYADEDARELASSVRAQRDQDDLGRYAGPLGGLEQRLDELWSEHPDAVVEPNTGEWGWGNQPIYPVEYMDRAYSIGVNWIAGTATAEYEGDEDGTDD